MRPIRRREGELVAMAFNQKEQRVLERSMATIRTEASYSFKLLDLNNRNLKLYFRQLRDTVSRLRSHLTADEIKQLRQLEAEGKLRPSLSPVNLGSALKIAATNRRLHPGRRQHQDALTATISAVPRAITAPPQPGLLKRSNSVTGVFMDAPPPSKPDHRPVSASAGTGGRLSPGANLLVNPSQENQDGGEAQTVSGIKTIDNPSKTGEEVRPTSRRSKTSEDQHQLSHDAPFPKDSQQSDSGPPQQQTPTTADCQDYKKLDDHRGSSDQGTMSQASVSYNAASSEYPQQSDSGPPQQQPLATADSHDSKRYDDHRGSSDQGTMGQASPSKSSPSHTRSISSVANRAFSSHAATGKAQEKEEGRSQRDSVAFTPRSHYNSVRKNSSFPGLLHDDALDEMDERLYEERRAELLEEEQCRTVHLTKRKEKFLKDLDQYLRDHPHSTQRPKLHRHTRRTSFKAKEGTMEDQEFHEVLLKDRRVAFDISPTCLPEENYRERLMGLWKDMSKCRYLRLADNCLDLSGVNTLATDTLNLYKVLKRRDRKPAHQW